MILVSDPYVTDCNSLAISTACTIRHIWRPHNSQEWTSVICGKYVTHWVYQDAHLFQCVFFATFHTYTKISCIAHLNDVTCTSHLQEVSCHEHMMTEAKGGGVLGMTLFDHMVQLKIYHSARFQTK